VAKIVHARTPAADAAELSGALEGLVSLLRRLAQRPDMSLTTASTLRMLDREGPRRLSDLALREGVSQPAMTQLVTRLERDGLARRQADPDDARVVLVAITDAGRSVLDQRRASRALALEELFETLPPGDRARIADALPALIRLSHAVPQT
jgi:DNA-binding MarR family transcriptional regulator